MNLHSRLPLALLMLSLAVAVPELGFAQAAPKSYSEIRKKDAARDARSQAKPLPQPRTVYRYTTKKRANGEASKGILPGAHMTSQGGAGRPLSATQAQHQYGLKRKPEVRETIRVPAGQPLKLNKVYGGQPGKGELTSPKRVPSSSVRKVVPLKK